MCSFNFSKILTFCRYFFSLTFTPGVEEQDEVLVGVVSSCNLVLYRAGHHSEPVQSNHSVGWRVDGQLDLVAVLLYDFGLPAFVLQVIHQWYDDMGAFRHQRQGTYTRQVVLNQGNVNLISVH